MRLGIPVRACLVAAVVAAATSAQVDAASRPAESRPMSESRPAEAPFTRRIGGDAAARAERVEKGGETIWTSGKSRIGTALPAGYPDPTPPGAVDLKRYPVVRRAEVTRSDDYDRGGSNGAFWPLFRHISDRGIAMTSPVEVDYEDAASPEAPSSRPKANAVARWTMSFLYRTADLGETGRDGSVTVVDRPGGLYLSIGFRGAYSRRTVDAALARLREVARELPEYEIAGPPRSLFYNGPEMRNADKWGEVQLPVRPRANP
jgi:hypothetical protein